MADAFDEMLTKTATILARPAGGDAYGAQSNTLTTIATGVPCRVSIGRGRAKEAKSPLKAARNYREVLMRNFVDSNGNQLSHKNWLQVDGQLFDIYQVDPVFDNDTGAATPHHLEVWCELILT